MDAKELARLVEESGQQNWMGLQFRKGRQYRNNNPKLPTLQPWVLRTKPPSNRFIFERNPYYHRVDTNGRQLPYIDRVLMTIASAKLIPAKVGAGEADLQARSLAFNNFTFLKRAEKRNNYDVRLWRSAKGSQMTLYPNLNVEDPVWRKLMRSVEFRRALSISINRHEVNQVIFFGLATAANNTVLTESQLYLPEYGTEWAQFDVAAANRLLDGLGLDKRDARGIRLLPDGRTMEITVETAGEDTEQADVLELIRDSWRQVGIKLHTRLQQREVFRNRVFAGQTLVSVWFGLENGVPNADTPPSELAPTSQQQLQWPKWGQHYETNGHAGERPDLPKAKELMDLYGQWVMTADPDGRLAIWHRMLTIHADQVFTIGLVRGVPQPVVVDRALRNVPAEGIYNWDPGAHFGIHKPDTFWFADENRRS
jgi:peptide/nickel transport system substrate-binding protein